MKCLTCGEYMYRGKKFNSRYSLITRINTMQLYKSKIVQYYRKECIAGETYLGIRKFRFYIKCSFCSAEIAFKTDPKNSDYEMESGATRNFEVWREGQAAVDAEDSVREEDEKVDAMKALEYRTLDSKLEMDVLDALDEIKAINQRHERVNTDALLSFNSSKRVSESSSSRSLTRQEEDELIKSVKFKSSRSSDVLDDDDDDTAAASYSVSKGTNSEGSNIFSQVRQQMSREAKIGSAIPVFIKKKRKIEDTAVVGIKEKEEEVPPSLATGIAGLMDYGSSGSEAE
jgi:hypothetical protein